MNNMSVFGSVTDNEQEDFITFSSDSLQSAERVFIEIMTQKYNKENFKEFKEHTFKYSDCYSYLRNITKATGKVSTFFRNTSDDELKGELFINFIYQLLNKAKVNYVNIKALSFEDILAINTLAECVSIRLLEETLIQFTHEDVYIYQVIRALFDTDPKLIENIKYYDKIKTTGYNDLNPVKESEEFTFNLIKRCIKLSINCTDQKIDINLPTNNLVNIACYGLANYTMHQAMGSYKKSPHFYLKMKRLLSNRCSLYYLYEITRAMIKHTFLTEQSAQSLIDGTLTTVQSLVARLSGASYAQLHTDSIENYNKYVQYVQTVLESVKFVKELDNKNLEEAEKIKDLKAQIKIARAELWELKKEKALQEQKEMETLIDETISITDIKREKEELKASNIISIHSKLKLLNKKRVLLLTTRKVDTSSLGDNIVVKNATEYKNKSISLDYDYVVLLTTGLSHAISYDVQADLKSSDTKLIFSSRTNINLILDDIIDQM